MVNSVNGAINTSTAPAEKVVGGKKAYYQHTKAYNGTDGVADISGYSIESAPEIEHFNNYSSAGTHLDTTNATPSAHADAPETNIFNQELIRLFVKPGVDVFVSSANHSQPAMLTTWIDSATRKIRNYMAQGVSDFITGKIGADEIMAIIENAYRELLAHNISLGNTCGTNPYYNARLLFNVQQHFESLVVMANINANKAEGSAIAKERGILCSWGHQRWVHYNAKFFFMNQDLQEIGRSAIAKIAQNEGFDFFVNTSPGPCFNVVWTEGANTRGLSTMKDTGLEPPRDFTLFFTADRFSTEARNNGTRQIIFASDPMRTDGHGSHTFHIWVPRGASLFSSMPLWLTQGTHVSGDGESFVAWDVTRHLNFKAGDDLNSRLREFFAKHVNNFDKGELLIWSGGEKSVHDVPFCIFFDNRRGFQGSELTSAVKHSAFINNFEFHIYNRRW